MYTHEDVVRVKGDDVYKTLTFALKRIYLVAVFASVLEDFVFKFWERIFFPDMHFFLFKKERKSSFCRQNQGHMLDMLSPQFLLSLAGTGSAPPFYVDHHISTFDLR